VGLVTFAFAGLAFAYFYLRSSNSFDLWRPKGTTAPTAFGGAILGLSLLAAVLLHFGIRKMRTGSLLDWDVAGWVGLAVGGLALGLQCDEFASLPFAPGASGYTSCFIGWSVLNCGLLFGGLYWLETLLARSLRLRRSLKSEGGVLLSNLPPARHFRASMDSCAFFWAYIAAVELLFWILFYGI
jgi:heme/copper-type cytochrome/quinol oxidase subunit 3